ncbi:TPA: replication initiation protein [Enterobacter hormaechei subsp. steigerwaltii]|nr:replication initiation protein [Enterobacter hormaechei subsp. steigerwaltii]
MREELDESGEDIEALREEMEREFAELSEEQKAKSNEFFEAVILTPMFQGGDLVKQSNALTDAAYRLSINGKRVLWLCLSDLVRRGKNENGFFPSDFRLSARIFRKHFGGSYDSSSRDLLAGIESLKNDGGVKFISRNAFVTAWVPWLVGESSICDGTPKAEHYLSFSPGIIKKIAALEKEYTRFHLTEVGKISNAKHARLYEKCRQWVSAGGFRIDKEDLARICDLNAAQMRNAAELKRRFLDPAIARIEKATTLKIAYTKEGDFYRFTVIDTAKTAKANTDGQPSEAEE